MIYVDTMENRVARRFQDQILAVRVAARFDSRIARGPVVEDEEEESTDSSQPHMPALWPDFLEEMHHGGKEKVRNPNPDTRKQFPQVSFSTALKLRPFFQRALKEYHRWLDRQDRTKGDKPFGKPHKSEEGSSSTGTPIGKPVHHAFSVIEHPESHRVKSALDAIGKVHGDGKLPKIPFFIGDYQNHGIYAHQGPKAAGIITRQGGGHMELNSLHEIGHFLDHQGIHKRGEFASHTDARLKPLMKAIGQSEAVKALQALAKNGKARGSDGKSYRVSTRQIKYQLRPHEMFARAYAQWVVLRSGDETLKKQLQGVLDEIEGQKVKRPRQWPEKDFEPIAREFDKAFRKIGWIK
jgi:hypothetical protein